jgi:hypothetical protein
MKDVTGCVNSEITARRETQMFMIKVPALQLAVFATSSTFLSRNNRASAVVVRYNN